MDDYRIEDYIQHYGVKGMKWGVRKDRRHHKKTRGAIDEATKKRILSEGGTIVPKGTTFNRVSRAPERRVHKKRTYTTYTDGDHDYYKQHMVQFRSRNFTRKMYDVSLQNVKDLAYPSHQKQVDEFVKLYEKHKVRVSRDMATEHVTRAALSRNIKLTPRQRKQLIEVVTKQYASIPKDRLNSFGYSEFMRTYSEIPVSKLYQKQLKKQGYNALRDDNDILYNTMDTIRPEKSIIVFDPGGKLKVVGSVELTRRDYDDAVARNDKRRKKVS